MQIIYSQTKLNFGDDLNLWLWPKLINPCLKNDDNILFLGIGTIVSRDFYKKHLSDAKKILLFSSGASDKPVPVIDEQWKVYCVRGPRTAKKLGVSQDLAIADGAYLLRTLDIPRPEKKTGIAFIPHHRSEDYINWDTICKKAGVTYLSPKQPVDVFLSKIQGCEKIISEAMLGKIPVYRFEVKAKVNDVDYPKKVYWIRRDKPVMLKEESYSLSGTLMQTAYFLSFTKIRGRLVPVKQLYVDEFEKGNKTIVEISGISTRTLDNTIFTKAYLENLSR